jgi:hypothetical protein
MRKKFYILDWKSGKTNYEFYSVWISGDEIEYCELMNKQNERMIGCLGEFERFYFIS